MARVSRPGHNWLCRHVTQLGGAAFTAALLYARPDRLVHLDREKSAQVERLAALANGTELIFRQVEGLPVELEETDLLLMDAGPDWPALPEQLTGLVTRVRKYLVLRGLDVEAGTGNGQPGSRPALAELLAGTGFRLKEEYDPAFGLAVLERVE